MWIFPHPHLVQLVFPFCASNQPTACHESTDEFIEASVVKLEAAKIHGNLARNGSSGLTSPPFFWLVVSNIFYSHPYLGKWSNLTNIFQMGWNHQPVFFFFWGGGVQQNARHEMGGGNSKNQTVISLMTWICWTMGFITIKQTTISCFPRHLLHANPRWFLHQTFGWFFLNDPWTWGYWQWANTNMVKHHSGER